MKELEINKMAVPKKERIINQMDIDYYDGLNKSLSEQYILKLEQEIRSWSIIFNNLIKQDALIHVLECAANEVSKRVKEINKIKNKLTKSKIMEWISVKDRTKLLFPSVESLYNPITIFDNK